ncbi:hypothetical protein F5146DRAFT_1005603 [Armillaria mellea]|nr:hypothetical protein F5146DRAFT_1005603 [Armillaria mellea]
MTTTLRGCSPVHSRYVCNISSVVLEKGNFTKTYQAQDAGETITFDFTCFYLAPSRVANRMEDFEKNIMGKMTDGGIDQLVTHDIDVTNKMNLSNVPITGSIIAQQLIEKNGLRHHLAHILHSCDVGTACHYATHPLKDALVTHVIMSTGTCGNRHHEGPGKLSGGSSAELNDTVFAKGSLFQKHLSKHMETPITTHGVVTWMFWDKEHNWKHNE